MYLLWFPLKLEIRYVDEIKALYGRLHSDYENLIAINVSWQNSNIMKNSLFKKCVLVLTLFESLVYKCCLYIDKVKKWIRAKS